MAAPAATQAAIKRALTAARDSGLTIAGFSVARDGTIEVTITREDMDSRRSNVQPAVPKKWAKR